MGELVWASAIENLNPGMLGISQPVVYVAAGLLAVLVILCIIVMSRYLGTKRNLLSYVEQVELLQDNLEEEQADRAEREEQYNQLLEKLELEKKSANTDPLTELQNQRAFNELLDNVMATIRKEERVAILHLDLDGFKKVNDELGHAYGDELIIDVTHRLMQAVDEDDFLARTEGDDFMILTQNIADTGAYEEKLKKIQTVMNYPFLLAGREMNVTVSMGICFAPKDGRVTRTLLRNADLALQEAKRAGKNTYFYYSEELEERSTSYMEQQAKLRSALAEEQLELWYEPRVNIASGKLTGFEASIRWNHPEDGLVDFTGYAKLANLTGLSIPIGYWVLEQVCAQMEKWSKGGKKGFSVSINLFQRQLRDTEFAAKVKENLEKYHIDRGNLIFEIKEHNLVQAAEENIKVINDLSQLGIKIAWDCFGEEYVAIEYLKSLPIHIVDISGNLLFHALEQEESRKMLQGLMLVAEALDLSVVAVDIEEPAEEELLKELGCGTAQGLLYGEPLPAEKIVF
ncbi:putative bifunctional diguanylate cyclase/phosphodiesterase [Anaerolentibacter hominis]|uniref:putative bifunctional diguanylate cyclase/phosphodiesterase n=1 Tax=Anaerolentibacter hominis TaxID=3079009 RepID=UPI0031B889B5